MQAEQAQTEQQSLARQKASLAAAQVAHQQVLAATQALTAELLDVRPGQVGLASTGVIGTELPREPLLAGVRAAVERLGGDADRFSRAILTSDRGPKRACVAVRLPNGSVRLSAQAKGAGMISPRFATMLCFVQTDLEMSSDTAELLTAVTVKRSFDRISVDGQLSTSDTVFMLAGGASGVRIEPETEAELRFGEAMDALLRALALEIVADGEGTRRVARIVVRGGAHVVEPVARAVASSPLVKTALHGGDPNWGRIVSAAGYSGVVFEEEQLSLWLGDLPLYQNGTPLPFDASTASAYLKNNREVSLRLRFTLGNGRCTFYTCDLTTEYVKLNADYTT